MHLPLEIVFFKGIQGGIHVHPPQGGHLCSRKGVRESNSFDREGGPPGPHSIHGFLLYLPTFWGSFMVNVGKEFHRCNSMGKWPEEGWVKVVWFVSCLILQVSHHNLASLPWTKSNVCWNSFSGVSRCLPYLPKYHENLRVPPPQCRPSPQEKRGPIKGLLWAYIL